MQDEEFREIDVIKDTELSEFVPVLFADSLNEAEQMKLLLEAHEIPTLVEGDRLDRSASGGLVRGVPVLVPDALLDAASALVAGAEEPRDGSSVEYQDEEEEIDEDSDEEDEDLDEDYDEEEDEDEDEGCDDLDEDTDEEDDCYIDG